MAESPDIKKLVALALERIARFKLLDYKPYPFQQAFHNAGATNQERMLMAGNRVGKTACASNEIAYHATGLYPSWWQGKRFDKPITVWVAAVTNESSRDIVQKELLGGLGADLGKGSLPADLIIGKPSMRQAGISDVVDTVKVRHRTGGTSTIVFKSYDQGWRKFQGTAPDVIWMDEEPDDYRLFTECLTRIMTSKGIILVTFTPLLGETDLVRHFMNPEASGIYLKTATWADAPHLSPADRERMAASFPEWERESRINGIPMMGEGRVFSISEKDIKVPRFEIPAHFARICGVDFGIEHYGAAVWMAWDRDRDIIFLYDSYRQKNQTSVYHAAAVKQRGPWIPVAWPHDGMNRGKADGRPLKDQFAEHGVNMLGMSARYRNDSGGPQAVEPIVMEVLERMRTGRFKVFEDQREWFEEFRSYHRDNGRIVDKNDDLLKASFYAVMMRRYAVTASTTRAADEVPMIAGLR